VRIQLLVSLKKKFLVNILLLVLLNALIKPFWVFGIDRTVQNTLGSDIYGLYFALFNFSILFNVFLDFGITNFNNRSIAQNPSLITSYLPRLVFTKFVFSIAYIIICFLVAISVGYSENVLILLGILILNQILASFLLFLRSNISGLHFFTTDSIISVVDRLLMILFCSLILWSKWTHLKMSIQLFAILQTLAYGITCVIAFSILTRHTGKISFSGVGLFSFSLIRESLPYALLGLLMGIHNRIDGVLLERLIPTGAVEAGIYAQSFRIFDAIGMVAVLFASLLLPMFSRLIAEKKDTKPLVKLSFTILFTGVFLLIINLVGFSEPLMKIMYPGLPPKSVEVFVILMISLLPVSLSYIFGTLLTSNGNLKNLNTIAVLALLLNIILNLILIPKSGSVGAAYSALFTQLFIFSIQIILCIHYFKFKFNIIYGLRYVIFIVCSGACVLLFKQTSMYFLSAFLLSLLVSLIAAIVLNIIDIKNIHQIIRFNSQTD
jgi:O-antigen/teichoic acid export membrane protein